MKENANVQEALRRLASLSPRHASARTAQRLRAAFLAKRKRRSPRRWSFAAMAAACVALVSVALVFHPWRSSPAIPKKQAAANGFIALPYSQSDVPMEQAVIVRVRLQPPQWGAFGLTPATPRASAIDADLLIGQDGVPRAVRLVSIP
jgi:ferric-dicitrate binding protein FerR (iron transport regulator)